MQIRQYIYGYLPIINVTCYESDVSAILYCWEYEVEDGRSVFGMVLSSLLSERDRHYFVSGHAYLVEFPFRVVF